MVEIPVGSLKLDDVHSESKTAPLSESLVGLRVEYVGLGLGLSFW